MPVLGEYSAAAQHKTSPNHFNDLTHGWLGFLYTLCKPSLVRVKSQPRIRHIADATTFYLPCKRRAAPKAEPRIGLLSTPLRTSHDERLWSSPSKIRRPHKQTPRIFIAPPLYLTPGFGPGRRGSRER